MNYTPFSYIFSCSIPEETDVEEENNNIDFFNSKDLYKVQDILGELLFDDCIVPELELE